MIIIIITVIMIIIIIKIKISTCPYVEQIIKGIIYQTHQEVYYTIHLLGAAIKINCQT